MVQLRQRNADGRAVTAKDGDIKSFESLFEGFDDNITTEPVKGGDVYYMKEVKNAGPGGKNLIKMVKYNKSIAKSKKIPKFRDDFNKVNDIIKPPQSGTPTDAEMKIVREAKKTYVDLLKTIDAKQFEQILRKKGYLNNVSNDDNTTNYADLEKFVDAAIKKYTDVHSTRPLSLKNAQYKQYINKVLMKVRSNYIPAVGGVTVSSANKSSTQSIYEHWTGASGKELLFTSTKLGSLEAAAFNALTAKNYDATSFANSNNHPNTAEIAALQNYATSRTIINDTVKNDNTIALVKHDKIATDKTGETFLTSHLQVFTPLLATSEELKALKDLIETIYDIFIEKTKKKIEDDTTGAIELDFQDGAKVGAHRRSTKTKKAPVKKVGRTPKGRRGVVRSGRKPSQ